MDNKNYPDQEINEDIPAPDMFNAQKIFDRIVDSAGMDRPAQPLEEVVQKVRKRHRINSFLVAACLTLILLIALMGFALFMRGYIANVTVSRDPVQSVQSVEPPRSVSVGYSDGSLYIQLAPGGLPLDYSELSVLRVSTGAAVTAEYDAAEDAVYIPCPRESDDYALTVHDSHGLAYTFTLHLAVNN